MMTVKKSRVDVSSVSSAVVHVVVKSVEDISSLDPVKSAVVDSPIVLESSVVDPSVPVVTEYPVVSSSVCSVVSVDSVVLHSSLTISSVRSVLPVHDALELSVVYSSAVLALSTHSVVLASSVAVVLTDNRVFTVVVPALSFRDADVIGTWMLSSLEEVSGEDVVCPDDVLSRFGEDKLPQSIVVTCVVWIPDIAGLLLLQMLVDMVLGVENMADILEARGAVTVHLPNTLTQFRSRSSVFKFIASISISVISLSSSSSSLL